jgi:hypothetical protein
VLREDVDENSRPHHNNRNFQITINGRSPLDALAMLHLERCAHRETRKELNQLKKQYEVLRDEFDSGEGMSQSTSLLFSCINGDGEVRKGRIPLSQNSEFQGSTHHIKKKLSSSHLYV